ncbi:MAG: hypothetical protein ACYCT2_04555 [Thermoplasmataceae archaeon]
MQSLRESMVPEEIVRELDERYPVRGSDFLVSMWNNTQVREPYSADEVEDLFMEVLA